MREDILECETGNRPYLLGHNRETGESVLHRPDCKLWSCKHCARVKAKQWASRARRGVRQEDGRDWHFMTVTVQEQSGVLARQVKIMAHAWDKLLKRGKRAFKHDWMTFTVPELGDTFGRLHYHTILDCGFDCIQRGGKWRSAWLHDNLKPCGLGYIYDISPLGSPEKASNYVTQYITSGFGVEFPKGFRRVRVSQNFPKFDEDEKTDEFDWQVIMCSPDGRRLLLGVLLSGEIVREAKTKKPIGFDHPILAIRHEVDLS